MIESKAFLYSHRGKCVGIPFKADFDSPGNAVWEFGAFNPKKGNPSRARASAAKLLKLGVLKVNVKKAGKLTVRFKLKPGAKTKKLFKQVQKLKLTER